MVFTSQVLSCCLEVYCSIHCIKFGKQKTNAQKTNTWNCKFEGPKSKAIFSVRINPKRALETANVVTFLEEFTEAYRLSMRSGSTDLWMFERHIRVGQCWKTFEQSTIWEKAFNHGNKMINFSMCPSAAINFALLGIHMLLEATWPSCSFALKGNYYTGACVRPSEISGRWNQQAFLSPDPKPFAVWSQKCHLPSWQSCICPWTRWFLVDLIYWVHHLKK